MEREYLLFRFHGTISSFGEIAVGQRRSIWQEPSKSAVLGFVAACLGIKREDEEELNKLDKSLGFAVRVNNYGKPLRDFHTAMAPTEAARTRRKKDKPLLTRKHDLECDDLSTMLSERLYKIDADYYIALFVKNDAVYDLASIEQAIKKPVFTPYLGRKTCPLAMPASPKIMEANSLINLFCQYDDYVNNLYNQLSDWKMGGLRKKKDGSLKLPIYFEIGAGLAEENDNLEIRQRRDALRDRKLWQFADRQEGKIFFTPEHKLEPEPKEDDIFNNIIGVGQ